MSNKLISNLVRCGIIIIALCGLLICGFWYPFSISLSVGGIVHADITQAQTVELWTQLSFYLLVSIPCFAILIICWTITNSISADKVFSLSVANRLKISAIVLFIDLAVFLIGNIIFLILGWNDFALVYFLTTAIGVFIATMIFVLSHYVKKAAIMKEENESYI